ncbi:MAG: FG-GAP-like repeat-containing protein [Pirellulaceae bacterium]|nr:FG-GAP-like repeat-containing protein [Pirellulaceae bacterium]
MLDLVAFKSTQFVTGNSFYSTVSVILADRPGEFATNDILRFTTAVNTYQQFFETGDFNNDGIVDLWSATYQAPSRTWLGLGDGSFAAPFVATPNLASGFIDKGFVGDFDQDGNLDVFWLGRGGVQNGPDAKFVAALGNGDGTFTITYNPLSSTNIVVPGDFNGDGYLDFVARKNNTSVDIYLYDVANPGTWQQATSFLFSSLGSSTGDYRGTLTVADFNQDGNLDVATAYRLSGGDVQLAILPGVGDGTFAAPISNPYGVTIPDYSSPAELASGDVNEDGIPDLVVYDSQAIGVHLGVGNGTFGTPTVIPASDPRQLYGHVFIKDLDYDGHQDILFTDSLGAAQLNFMRGNGDGTFKERITYDPAINAGYVEFGDLDNDGRDELILSSPDGSDYATILYATRERLTDIVSADLNGDGNDDVLATNFDNSRVKWFLGNNLGQLVKQPDLLTDNGPVSLVVADFNQDLANEIITVNRSGRSVSIFAGPSGAYTRTDVSVGRTPIAVTAAFVNADSSQDLLVLDEGLNTVWYLQGNNNLTFAAPVPIPLGDRPNDVLAGDVNGDGFTDIVVSLPDTKRFMILPGNGTGNFTSPVYVALPGSPTAIGLSDFNQDGRVDLAAAISGLDQVSILYGRGQLQFAKPQAISVGDQPASLKIEDADGDGRDDIIVANRGDDTASVIFNRFDPTKVYRYDALAIDPDDDVVSYELVDAPGGLILNAETGQILWAPTAEQIGLQLVTIAASDGRGGISTQSFNIDVVPARENSAPLIGSLPQTTIGAGEGFTYSVKAADTDNDSLRYRLLDGPEGATIDPISGLVTWDARLNAARLNELTQISQHLIVPATAALQPASVTAEGWFKFAGLSSSETLIRKTNGFSGTSYRLSIVSGILRATVGATTSSSADDFVTYNLNREVGRWYHLAMSFDDITKQLSLFVDGQQVATTTANLTIGYENDTEVFIAGTATKFNGEIGMVRIWNVARPQTLLQQSMSKQADSTDPALVLDLDFSSVEAQTMRDKSSYQHIAVRSGTGDVYPKPTSGLAFAQAAPFAVSVEDGRGGFDTQSFTVDIVPELRGNIAGKLTNNSTPLFGWQLFIDTNDNSFPDPTEQRTVTNATGNYTFNRLLPGIYPLRVSPTAGFATPALQNISVTANQTATNDIAIAQLALSQIRGKLETENDTAIANWGVYADLDNDGSLDDDEPFGSSDRNGNYALAGLAAGTYRVRPDLPASWADVAGRDGLSVTLATDAIFAGNDFTLRPTNTSVTGGVHFVTKPNTDIIARQVFRYASIATSIDGSAIVYDLSLAPAGMSIDPNSGLVAWRPTIAQVGEHLVILRATDRTGSITLQDFSITVAAPNSLPVFSVPRRSAVVPATIAYVGHVYSYDIIAQDAESTALTYTLTQSPTGAVIDSTTGRLTWTPAASAVGSQDFTVLVTDEAGGTTTTSWTVNVENTVPVNLPLIVMLPRGSATVTTDYLSRITATDNLGQPVTWALVSGPVGIAVQSDGTIRWTPSVSQLGTQAIELTATTADGNEQLVSFDIKVTGFFVNASPVIGSSPNRSIALGQTFTYDLDVRDTDRDIFAFTLLEAPVGMSVHPSLGTIRWTPAADQLGESNVIVQVADPSGATATQEFKLKVSRFGGPPRITSVPPTEAAVGGAYLYSVVAIDAENDPLSYSLLAAPNGLTIVETTGEIVWTPTGDQIGRQEIVIQVIDGIGGAATQVFVIRVSAGASNLPPVIQSSSPRFGAVGTPYIYSIVATDPESTAITYSLGRGPTGLTVDATTGLVGWTPAVGQTGKFVITLIATDAGGASAVESFEFDVLAQNIAPVINSNAPVDVAAGAEFRYDVLAKDANIDQLRFELSTSPAGATIDSFGRIRWQTNTSLIGSHNFTLRVSDPRGGSSMQSFILAVIEDTIAPKLSSIVTPGENAVGNQPWGPSFVLYVRAIDNVAISSLTLTANGRDIPLSAAGTATFTFEEWRFTRINTIARAVDTNGNVTEKTVVFDYDFPEGWGGGDPQVIPTAIITSPADAASVTGMVSIVGTAAHADFAAYKLSYRHVDQTEFIEFFESTTAVTSGELGVWDTSLLLNDEYVIRLEVATNAGVVNVVEQNVGLGGELKLGNFRLSFTDMVIPVAGIPIEITRIYDTLQADREGDFGFGWRLEYRNTDLRVGLPKSGLEDIGIYSALREGVKVYLNIPGEGRQGFTFTPDIRILPGFGNNNLTLARPRFTPDPGVTSRLSTGTNNYLQVNERNELYAPGGIPYNPASLDFGGAYVLTTSEGTIYRVNGEDGELISATDRNGNTLRFSGFGIVSGENARNIQFVRDTAGRISRITDSNGISVQYKYSSNGDLASVIDGTGNETKLTYALDRAHYLEDIVDPLGRKGAKTDYDAQGRLVRIVDSLGNPIALASDPNNLVESITDPNGNRLTVEYDSRGNTVGQLDARGAITRRTFDANNNLTSEMDPLGNTTSYTYDSRGNTTSTTNPLGHRQTFTYGVNGQILRQVDEIGAVTENQLDSKGNVLSTKDTLGNVTTFTYDTKGNQLSETDALGNLTRYAYDSAGNLTSQTNALGHATHSTFDARGNQLSETSSMTTLTGVVTVTTAWTYDANGRETSRRDALGNTTRTEYNPLGQESATVDEKGNRTEYTYDERGLLSSTRFANGSTRSSTYDSNGRRVSRTDQLGRVTHFEYDSVGNLVTTAYADSTPNILADNPRTRREYDLAGRVVARIDELGNRTEYRYDAAGMSIAVILPDNTPANSADNLRSETFFDARGLRTRTIDPMSGHTDYTFDLNKNLVSTQFSDGTKTQQQFDGPGRRIAEIDQNGVATRYQYDANDRLIAVVQTLADPNATQPMTIYGYDEQGNLSLQTDANGNTTQYHYDVLSRRVGTTMALGQQSTTVYDAVGNVLSETNFIGERIDFTYDTLNRVTLRELADGSSFAFTYTPTGRTKTIVDSRGTTTYTYDILDRVLSRAEPDGTAISYGYDFAGNEVSQTTPAGTVSKSYNALSQLATVTDTKGGVTTYGYDARGRLVKTQYPNGTSDLLALDELSRIRRIETQGPTGVIRSMDYTLDATGRRIAIVESSGRRVTYDYDSLYRLVAERITDSTLGNRTIEYVYDSVGNRMTKLDSVAGITVYVYDDNDRLLEDTTAGVKATYTYDANGNTLTKFINANNRTTYRWNAENRLISATIVDASGTTDVTYKYDADGLRVESTTGGETERLLLDKNRQYAEVVLEYSPGGAILAAYVRGHQLISTTRSDEQAFYHADAIGTVRILTNSLGVITSEYAYDAFGVVLNQTVGIANPFLFAGEFRDSQLNIDFLRARYYDITSGRFPSRDSFDGVIRIPNSLHRYAYTHSDPVNNRDPSGNFTLKELLVVSAKIGILLVVGVKLYRAYRTSTSTLVGTLVKRFEERTYQFERGEFTFGAIYGAGGVSLKIKGFDNDPNKWVTEIAYTRRMIAQLKDLRKVNFKDWNLYITNMRQAFDSMGTKNQETFWCSLGVESRRAIKYIHLKFYKGLNTYESCPPAEDSEG